MTTQEENPRLGYKALATRMVPVRDIAIIDRIVTPTKTRVDNMVKSFKEVGQLFPIMITEHRTAWRIVAGATRLMAAKELKMDEVNAIPITTFNEFECQLIEIAENLARHDLSDNERAKLKAKEKEIQAAKKAHYEAAFAKLKAKEEADKAKPKAERTRHDKPTGNKKGRPQSAESKAAEEAGLSVETIRTQRKRAAISGSKITEPENAGSKVSHLYDGLSKGSPPSAPGKKDHLGEPAGHWEKCHVCEGSGREDPEPEVTISVENATAAVLAAFDVLLEALKAKQATALEMYDVVKGLKLEMDQRPWEAQPEDESFEEAERARRSAGAKRAAATRKAKAEVMPSDDLDDVPDFLDRTKLRSAS